MIFQSFSNKNTNKVYCDHQNCVLWHFCLLLFVNTRLTKGVGTSAWIFPGFPKTVTSYEDGYGSFGHQWNEDTHSYSLVTDIRYRGGVCCREGNATTSTSDDVTDNFSGGQCLFCFVSSFFTYVISIQIINKGLNTRNQIDLQYLFFFKEKWILCFVSKLFPIYLFCWCIKQQTFHYIYPF